MVTIKGKQTAHGFHYKQCTFRALAEDAVVLYGFGPPQGSPTLCILILLEIANSILPAFHPHAVPYAVRKQCGECHAE
jgi:hypothetical protein